MIFTSKDRKFCTESKFVYILTFQRSPESYGMQSRKMRFVILKKYILSILLISFYTIHFFCYSCEISSFYLNLLFSGAPLWSKISWSIGHWPIKRSHDGCSAVLPSRSRCQSLELIFFTRNASFRLQESRWFPSEE